MDLLSKLSIKLLWEIILKEEVEEHYKPTEFQMTKKLILLQSVYLFCLEDQPKL